MFSNLFGLEGYKEKKGQVGIGTTLTWIPAIVLVSFVMIVFIVTVGMIAVKDVGQHGKDLGVGLGLGDSGSKSLYLQRELSSFLNSPINYNREKIRIKDLMRDSLPTPKKTQGNSGKNFMENIKKKTKEQWGFDGNNDEKEGVKKIKKRYEELSGLADEFVEKIRADMKAEVKFEIIPIFSEGERRHLYKDYNEYAFYTGSSSSKFYIVSEVVYGKLVKISVG